MTPSTELQKKIDDAANLLADIAVNHAPAGLANSFGAEDMVLMDLIRKHAPAIRIFTLDTGRLNKETYELMQQARTHYGMDIKTYFPDYRALEEYLENHGPNAFYDNVELRKRCCGIRKVEPLKRALAELTAWITGLRRQQSPTRVDLSTKEWDSGNGMHKFNPLIEWTEKDVWAYIRHFGVPYNALHDQHYPSIGCAPCTRAIAVGEDIRAGRWWWEDPASKECGLHIKKAAG